MHHVNGGLPLRHYFAHAKLTGFAGSAGGDLTGRHTVVHLRRPDSKFLPDSPPFP